MRKMFRGSWVYAAIIGVSVLGSIVVAQLGLPHSAEAGSWFQGFGTVGAILVSIALVERAERRAVAERKAETNRFIGHIATLAGAAHTIVIGMQKAVLAGKADELLTWFPQGADLGLQFQKWAELPIQHWPQPFLSVQVDSLGRTFNSIRAQAAPIYVSLRDGNGVTTDMRADLWQSLAEFEERMERVSSLAELTFKL